MYKPRIIYSNNLSNSILFIGGIAFILIGSYLLSNANEWEVHQYIGYLFSSFFILIGICSIFSVLDNLYITIENESIKIKSLFRKKEISRKEIIGFEIKYVEGKYLSGEKIRILTTNKTLTIDTIRFEYTSTSAVLAALKNKKEVKGLFKTENLLQSIYFYSTTIISLIIAFAVFIILLFVFIMMFFP